jgi:acyl dehydratase
MSAEVSPGPSKAVDLDQPVIYFEDLQIGMECDSAGRTVTEADVVAFAGLSGDYNQLHVDEEFAGETVHGGRIAHGLLVLSILSGLCTRVALMQGLGGSIIGLGGLECRWKRPVKIGDTLHVRLSVTELRRTSKGDRGVVMLQRDAVNQRGEVVLESMWTLIVRCQSDESRT